MQSKFFFPPELLQKWSVVDWGYTEEPLARSYKHYCDWVEEGKADPLGYLQDERKLMRESLENYFPEFQSALVFMFDYSKVKAQIEASYKELKWNGLKLAAYVLGFQGKDYHVILKQALSELADQLPKHEEMQVKLSLDTQPILERDLAYRAGLGWFGKNSMLISKSHGSYTLLGSLLLSRKLPLRSPSVDTDHCGHCRACIDACPTNAIDNQTRTLNSSQCLSTFTIETFKEKAPPVGYEKSNGEFFGCDICQEVCPWNSQRTESSFQSDFVNFFLQRPIREIVNDLEKLSNREFKRKFKETPLERTGRVGLLKNLRPFIQRQKLS